MSKKYYTGVFNVLKANGWQLYGVWAESKEEAIELLGKGKGNEFIEEEVEVYDLRLDKASVKIDESRE